jgi:transglutaminase-like putative cysteine protease
MARQIAAESAGDTAAETAARVSDAVSQAMTYADGVTSVATTAAEALDAGHGVCQDYAHVMLALCHVLKLPARYVSGHLLGQGGTHAWVEVIVPRGDHAQAIAFDPCNGRRTDEGYVTIATGRDYRDVAPTSGRYSGASSGRLTAARRVGVLAAALPAGKLVPAAPWSRTGRLR